MSRARFMNNSWRKAERIFVLREGTIAEEGSHEQLMAKGGLYARMYGAQARDCEKYAKKPKKKLTVF